MQNLTVRLHLRTIAELEQEADERGVSRSEYIRNLIETRHESSAIQDEYEDRIDKLERDLEIAENRLDEARGQMKARDDVEEKVDLLAKRQEEQEELLSAPFWVRWKRYFSRGSDDEE